MREIYEKRYLVEGKTLLKYYGTEENVILPDEILYIAPHAFENCKEIKRVVAPVNLKSIGQGAFFGCDNLSEITIPGAIYSSVRRGNVLPEGKKIYFRFYANVGRKPSDADYSEEEEIPAEANAAAEDLLAEAENVDKSQTEFDEDAENLEEKMKAVIPPDEQDISLTPRGEVKNYSEFLVDGDVVIKYLGTAKAITVPPFITRVGDGAFSNTEIESVELPEGIRHIGKNAFSWCLSLKKINLPKAVEKIDDGAFSNCQSLEEIIFPTGLKSIGADAFRACSSLKSIELPHGLRTLSRRAFDFCIQIEKVVVPPRIKSLTEGVFSHCEKLRKVTLPQGIKSVGSWAFAECYELREINFPEGLQTIGEVAFFNCRSLVAFDLPASLEDIGRQAFVGCTSLRLVNLYVGMEDKIKSSRAFHRLTNVIFNYTGKQSPPNE